MAKKDSSPEAGFKIVAENRRARYDYHLVEKFEAGIVLSGAEIKSIRQGGINLAQSYVQPMGGELFLLGAHITQYAFDTGKEYDPLRKRKLLLKRHEIDKLTSRVEAKGFTLVPVKLYLKKGRAKVEIALAKGKDAPDKRDAVRDRDTKREMARAMRDKK